MGKCGAEQIKCTYGKFFVDNGTCYKLNNLKDFEVADVQKCINAFVMQMLNIRKRK